MPRTGSVPPLTPVGEHQADHGGQSAARRVKGAQCRRGRRRTAAFPHRGPLLMRQATGTDRCRRVGAAAAAAVLLLVEGAAEAAGAVGHQVGGVAKRVQHVEAPQLVEQGLTDIILKPQCEIERGGGGGGGGRAGCR